MADVPTNEDFGSPEALLRVIQERSDDIERVTIYGPGTVMTYPGGRPQLFKSFAMIFHLVGGRMMTVHPADAEMVLNDGIVNRMGIRIEFAKV